MVVESVIFKVYSTQVILLVNTHKMRQTFSSLHQNRISASYLTKVALSKHTFKDLDGLHIPRNNMIGSLKARWYAA